MARRKAGPVTDSTDSTKPPVVDVELARQLVEQAQAEGVQLTGPGGLPRTL